MFADLLEIVLVPCPYILFDGGLTMNVGIEVQKSNGTDQRKKEDE